MKKYQMKKNWNSTKGGKKLKQNRLIEYVTGYVDIVIEGYYIEKFINICNSKQVNLWNIKKENSIKMLASIKISDFKELKQICRKTKCKVKIQNKKGLPFIIKKYKKRKVFLLFLMLIILSIIVLSNFIWNIEIEGDTNIPKEEIIELVKNEGLEIGAFKGKIDTKKIINKIRLERDDVSWVGINIEGTNAVIKLVKADAKPEIINEEEYCNIIADKDATILKVSAQNGTPLVKEGDTVTNGDIIVAGWMEGKYTGKQYVHAQGEVQAKVKYTTTERVYLKETKKVETGVSENRYSVKINNFKINLPKTLPKFQKYDTIEENKKLKLFSNFYLPFELITYTYKEYEEQLIIHSFEEAKQIGIDKAKESLQEELDGKEILDKQVNVTSEPDYIEVEVTYEVKENIGIKEKIIF